MDSSSRHGGGSCADLDASIEVLRLHRERLGPLLAEHDALMAQALAAHQVEVSVVVASEERVLTSRLLLAQSGLALRRSLMSLDDAVGERLAGASAAR